MREAKAAGAYTFLQAEEKNSQAAAGAASTAMLLAEGTPDAEATHAAFDAACARFREARARAAEQATAGKP